MTRRQSLSGAGLIAALARSIRSRSHGSPPLASILAQWAGSKRIDRCSMRASGGPGGLPRSAFGSIDPLFGFLVMDASLAEFMNHKKSLDVGDLMNHTKCNLAAQSSDVAHDRPSAHFTSRNF